MYESVISHPPEDWEVIPSIHVGVGERLKEEYPDPANRPVINIDVGAARFALKNIQRSDAAPTVVSFMLQETIGNHPDKTRPKYIAGTALGTGWGTDIRLATIDPATEKAQTPEKLQEFAVHELKHAADYTSTSMRLANKEYHKKLGNFKERLQISWKLTIDKFLFDNISTLSMYPSGKGLLYMQDQERPLSYREHVYFNKPTEVAAYATSEDAQKLPRIISFDKPKKKK